LKEKRNITLLTEADNFIFFLGMPEKKESPAGPYDLGTEGGTETAHRVWILTF